MLSQLQNLIKKLMETKSNTRTGKFCNQFGLSTQEQTKIQNNILIGRQKIPLSISIILQIMLTQYPPSTLVFSIWYPKIQVSRSQNLTKIKTCHTLKSAVIGSCRLPTNQVFISISGFGRTSSASSTLVFTKKKINQLQFQPFHINTQYILNHFFTTKHEYHIHKQQLYSP